MAEELKVSVCVVGVILFQDVIGRWRGEGFRRGGGHVA